VWISCPHGEWKAVKSKITPFFGIFKYKSLKTHSRIMKKYNLVKVENGKEEVVLENVSIELAIAYVNVRKADGLVSVNSLDVVQQMDVEEEGNVVVFKAYDAEPAWEDKLTKKPQE